MLPQAEHCVNLSVIPIVSGETRYPEITVIWMKNNNSNTGSTSNGSTTGTGNNWTNRYSNIMERNVFVYP